MASGSRPTAAYRCFFLDDDGSKRAVASFERETPDLAIEETRRRLRLSDFAAAELWREGQVVARLTRD